jgi:hypothetical protein
MEELAVDFLFKIHQFEEIENRQQIAHIDMSVLRVDRKIIRMSFCEGRMEC